MKNILFIFCILIIFFKTGNVLSKNDIFNVDNIEINIENSTNKEKLVDKAFSKGFAKLLNRLLLDNDYKKLLSTNLTTVKKLISHYQISDEEDKIILNIYFDKEKMYNFFYEENILYSDILNTEVIFFPLAVIDKKYFIYSNNFFIENWNKKKETRDLIQYILPQESIENIKKIENYKFDIFNLEISDFFEEFTNENMVFTIIELENNKAKIFLNTKIEGKELKKNLIVNNVYLNEVEFYNNIILEIKNTIKDLIKSQNLIDVRTPSFLNVKINLKTKNNLVEFKNRLDQINLITNFNVQKLNKDYALIKIRYFGKINKIINKLKENKMDLKLINGSWNINLT